ncbi:MAG: 2-C-methyl-D-erythritol 4-phosphate cytidylyltransferase [Clostridia bacterium]|nr:2-C-methyl-D-erythritol 4-phosphate cytidylyltransferase [Clostridia bacterium]
MIYGAILAGGVGRRLTGSSIPKQFVPIGDIPIVIWTMKPFVKNKRVDEIYVAVHKDWIGDTESLFKKFFPDDIGRIHIVEGGTERIDSFFNIVNHIVSQKKTSPDDIVVFQEGVRPFSNPNTIDACIDTALEYKYATAVTPMIYSIAVSEDGDYLNGSLDRGNLYEIHTPSGFNVEMLYNATRNIGEEYRKRATCTSMLMLMLGNKVKTFLTQPGDFKITTDKDLQYAKYLYDNNIFKFDR